LAILPAAVVLEDDGIPLVGRTDECELFFRHVSDILSFKTRPQGLYFPSLLHRFTHTHTH
jgi:hypothetical protein